MIYLNEKDLKKIGVNWNDLIESIKDATIALNKGECVQPIKPYLRYKNLKNRIIAMPAYVGGKVDKSGIKWIASFPENIQKGKARAHSVVILNNSETGEPIAVINTALLSIVRTASVSGLIIKYYDKVKNLKNVNIGIIGWGPIGQYHFKMCKEILGDRISNIYIYDKKAVVDKNSDTINNDSRVVVCNNWESVYENSDLFITCTVSDEPYIDKKPKKGALLLNVSLRDFKVDIFENVKNSILVDDWDEICRENTDIERLHKEKGLQKEMVKSIVDVVCNECLGKYKQDENIMFNPMGMAIFDITIGNYYLNKAIDLKLGTELE